MKGQRNGKTKLCAVAFLLVPALVHAQTVPALKQDAERIAEDKALPAVNLISNKRVALDRKEAAGMALANRWKKHPERPRRGADGRVTYLYGATLPTLVCAPLQACAIELQAGEFVNDLHAGDKVRWRIIPATTGKGDRYYGAASTTPVTVFTSLLRLKNAHLKKLSNARVVWFEKQLGEVLGEIDDFPAHLMLPDQGRFALGYYHQRQAFFTKNTSEPTVTAEGNQL